jgi:hypothetical protein
MARSGELPARPLTRSVALDLSDAARKAAERHLLPPGAFGRLLDNRFASRTAWRTPPRLTPL